MSPPPDVFRESAGVIDGEAPTPDEIPQAEVDKLHARYTQVYGQ
jgi:hypothetical protein